MPATADQQRVRPLGFPELRVERQATLMDRCMEFRFEAGVRPERMWITFHVHATELWNESARGLVEFYCVKAIEQLQCAYVTAHGRRPPLDWCSFLNADADLLVAAIEKARSEKRWCDENGIGQPKPFTDFLYSETLARGLSHSL